MSIRIPVGPILSSSLKLIVWFALSNPDSVVVFEAGFVRKTNESSNVLSKSFSMVDSCSFCLHPSDLFNLVEFICVASSGSESADELSFFLKRI